MIRFESVEPLKLNTAVFLSAFFGVIVGDGLFFTITFGTKVFRIYPFDD